MFYVLWFFFFFFFLFYLFIFLLFFLRVIFMLDGSGSDGDVVVVMKSRRICKLEMILRLSPGCPDARVWTSKIHRFVTDECKRDTDTCSSEAETLKLLLCSLFCFSLRSASLTNLAAA